MGKFRQFHPEYFRRLRRANLSAEKKRAPLWVPFVASRSGLMDLWLDGLTVL